MTDDVTINMDNKMRTFDKELGFLMRRYFNNFFS